MRMDHLASSLASHATLKAAAVGTNGVVSVCAARWGWDLFRYCVKNDFGEGFGHLKRCYWAGRVGRKLG